MKTALVTILPDEVAENFSEWLKDNHTGKENAINARSMRRWGNAREIRFMTHRLRLQGVPICSGNDGYFYASNQRELDETLNRLESMDDDLTKVIHALNKTRNAMG